MVLGINHITLAVSDLERSFIFYREVLGFQPLFKSAVNAYFLAGDLWFCLQEDKTISKNPRLDYSHIALSVSPDAFQKLSIKMKEAEIKLWQNNRSEGDSLYFLDPDAHKLEIHLGTWRSRIRDYGTRPEMRQFVVDSGHRPSHLKTPGIDADVKLTGFKLEYLDLFYSWRHQKATLAHNPIEEKSKAELMGDLIQESAEISELNSASRIRWFIDYRGVVVGNVSFRNVNLKMGTIEIGYGLDEAYFGRGIAKAGVRMAIRRLLIESSLRKIIAYVHDENLPSLNLLRGLGFFQEGLLRAHYIIQGVPANEVVFGLLREDFDLLGGKV